MKRYLPSFFIGGLHVQTTRYHLGWQKSKTLAIPNADKDAEQQELSFTAGGNADWYSHFGRQFGSFLQSQT